MITWITNCTFVHTVLVRHQQQRSLRLARQEFSGEHGGLRFRIQKEISNTYSTQPAGAATVKLVFFEILYEQLYAHHFCVLFSVIAQCAAFRSL